MPPFRENEKAQRHRLRSVALNLSADQAAEALEFMAKRWHEILDGKGVLHCLLFCCAMQCYRVLCCVVMCCSLVLLTV